MASESYFYSIRDSHRSSVNNKSTSKVSTNRNNSTSISSIHYLNVISQGLDNSNNVKSSSKHSASSSRREISESQEIPMSAQSKPIKIRRNASPKKREKTEKTEQSGSPSQKSKSRDSSKNSKESSSPQTQSKSVGESSPLLNLFSHNSRGEEGEKLEVLLQRAEEMKKQAKTQKEERRKSTRSKILFEQLINPELYSGDEFSDSLLQLSEPPIPPPEFTATPLISPSVPPPFSYSPPLHDSSLSDQAISNKLKKSSKSNSPPTKKLPKNIHASENQNSFQRTPTPIRSKSSKDETLLVKPFNNNFTTYSDLLVWNPKRLNTTIEGKSSEQFSSSVKKTKTVTTRVSSRKQTHSNQLSSNRSLLCEICKKEINGRYWECQLHRGTKTVNLHIHCRKIQSCTSCGEDVTRGPCVSSKGLRWHLYCFNCTHCKYPLSSFFYLRKAKFSHHFAAFCTKCKNV